MSKEQLPLFGEPEPAAVNGAPLPAPSAERPAMASQALTEFELQPQSEVDPDADARVFAVNPHNNVVLEASAGTGKTSVLVARYVNLLKARIEPGNILAITFTRKAAAEMRERIVRELRESAARSEADKARWIELRDRIGEIAISTIDAFCLSLLREFPLEADLDPGFDMADETEVPRIVEASLDKSLRILSGLARTDPDIALVLAQLGVSRTREGLASLLDRRMVAWDALDRFLAKGPSDLTADVVCRRAATALQDALRAVPGGLARFLAEGPVDHPRYQMLVRDLERLGEWDHVSDAEIRSLLDRVASHFLTNEGTPRKGNSIPPYNAGYAPSPEAWKRHRNAVAQIAPHVERVVTAFGRDLNAVLARGIKRMFAVALTHYREALEERSVLDFSDVLQRALNLLRQMDEFSQSRFRLESRYHHVLVDEFQDTSRAQWELVSLLIQSWGQGLGLASQPSIFIVGDRKQSIYRFRDAEVAVMREAGRYIEALRPGGTTRRSISRSFRAVPELLEFVNEVFVEMSQRGTRPDDFTYGDSDRFPPAGAAASSARGPVLGVAVADDAAICAASVAAEIERILREDSIRDRKTGVPRQAQPGDIAILFRSRASHREFEHELEIRGIPTYVYKGLGFFDADEIKDMTALLRYLADPASDLRAAAFLRSRFIGMSDKGLSLLAPRVASAVTDPALPAAFAQLRDEDREVLEYLRQHCGGWLAMVDHVPPAELIEQLLPSTAYAYEIRGGRRQQAWENLKKMRGLVRRIQNRGYATLTRIADHIDALTAGDESNAVLEALDAVNLMTVHASKGLEFPIVFVVNLAKGASGPGRPMRVIADGEGGEPSVSIGPFVSETDELEREREKHETRRLMYVALTRARDRLYLSTALKDGVLQPGRGSLAEVLPDSLKRLFPRAAAAVVEDCATLNWSGQSGRPFEWRICRPPIVPPARVTAVATVQPGTAQGFEALVDAGATVRIPVTQWLSAAPEGEDAAEPGAPQDVAVGTLVHRLFQFGDAAGPSAEEEAAYARGLLRGDERAVVEDVDLVIRQALDVWHSMRRREDVAAVLAAGRRFYEVPFSLRVTNADGPYILRGTMDCLVQREDGSIVIVEFKTGRRRPAHQRQLDIYIEAARALYPGVPVEGLLVYPDAR
jgi:ATP-dependent helicase/nuclease subunit A